MKNKMKKLVIPVHIIVAVFITVLSHLDTFCESIIEKMNLNISLVHIIIMLYVLLIIFNIIYWILYGKEMHAAKLEKRYYKKQMELNKNE